MAYTLPDLPYGYDALNPHIDTDTMHIHHTKHHQAYINKLNGWLEENSEHKGKDLTQLVADATNLSTTVRNHGGGHYNHSLFWRFMAKTGTTNPDPHGELKTKIDEKWGSFEKMKEEFNQAASTRFGSGWAWLGVKSGGELTICSTANQDNPLMKLGDCDCIPILGLDVWEHAYYLKYQNRRPEYINAFWNVVNWDNVVHFYDDYAKHGKPVPAKED